MISSFCTNFYIHPGIIYYYTKLITNMLTFPIFIRQLIEVNMFLSLTTFGVQDLPFLSLSWNHLDIMAVIFFDEW